MKHSRSLKGFTIVELLIVIVVIAILAAISIVAYNGIQARAQDAKRAQDLSVIEKAILGYNATNGGVPRTHIYASNGAGGWDNSSHANWLAFLRPTHGDMPRDSVNIINTTDGVPDEPGERAYFYYCYNQGSGPRPATPNVRIGYRAAQTDAYVNQFLVVDSCL